MAKKKTVKPTRAEAEKIKRRLQKQYPQMYEPVVSPGTKAQLKQAKGEDRKALLKMVAKKLKKLYRSK